MPKVLFKQSGRSTSCEPGDYLLDLCEAQGGGLKFSCRTGACGACVIDVATTPNGLNPMSARERRTLEGVGADLTKHRVDARSTRNVRLYFGLRHVHDIFYRDELDQVAKRLPNCRYQYGLSQPFPARWDGFVGRVTDLLRQELTRDVAVRSEAYLCGGHGLVDDAKSILLAAGCSTDAIYHEQFY